MTSLPPGVLIVVGSLLIPLLRGRVQKGYMLLLPVLSLIHLLMLPHGIHCRWMVFDYELQVTRIDKLSFIFGVIFHIAALLNTIFALHVKDRLQHLTGLMYAGAGIGAVFAGDLITLFFYWELTAISSVFLIWARRTERSYRAGMRYLIIQIGSGVILLAGVLVHYKATGDLTFDALGIGTLGTNLIFLAFGIKCAFPLLHNWLQDAYPEATPTGTVILSAFTTKLAVYALARGYAGTEMLIWIGATMTAFPIFYAVLENDLRRVLAYSLNNQLGFMVVGIGVGTELALNGTAAHAFAHILYKALLFMSMGAVLHRVGTTKCTELGGLYKSMPWTTAFCIVGAASISAFPLLSGFVSKSMILAAVAEEHHTITWFVLLFASAGVLHHSGIKVPFFAFFHGDSGIRVREAPLNMLIAMGGAAFLCIAIGIFPGALYSLLPYSVEFIPYTASHVVTQMQLLMMAILAFCLLFRHHIDPPEVECVNLDSDWIYRKVLPSGWRTVSTATVAMGRIITRTRRLILGFLVERIYGLVGPEGALARTQPTGHMALVVALLLGTYLVLYYVA